LAGPGPKVGGRCKQRAIIFHGGRVIVNFVSKFLAMATGFVRGYIQMTPLDCPTQKKRQVQTARNGDAENARNENTRHEYTGK